MEELVQTRLRGRSFLNFSFADQRDLTRFSLHPREKLGRWGIIQLSFFTLTNYSPGQKVIQNCIFSKND